MSGHHVALPKAIGEDHSPFWFAGLPPSQGFARLLIFLRWKTYRCPHCGHVFRRDYWQRSVKLGCGQRTCSKCGTLFDDSSREWPELPAIKKLRVLFPPLLFGVCGGFLLGGVVVSLMPPRDWRVTIAMVIFVPVPVVAYCLCRLPWVVYSVHRYNARPKVT